MTYIDRNNYKELDLILWDTRKKLIAPKDAFAFYEGRWGHVDKNKLDKLELALIDDLIKQVGNGHFLPVAA
jgi:hypothetical protein